ncbi:MAG: universal stress protein [Alphaproteobacteria bacterium]|nr:universal stress protein [Alphaproteobacteria bacterium]
MYKKILIATDGSELSRKAEEHGIALAKVVGAAILGVTVTMPLSAYMTSDVAIAYDPSIFEERTAEMAAGRLDAVAAIAAREGVPCETMRVESDPIYKGLVETAEQQGCDLIVMASHGRSGLSGFILGSETTKVLTHSTIPILVCR